MRVIVLPSQPRAQQGVFIALTTSILIVLGIYLIREVFEEQQQAEENTALRNQIAATQLDETKS
ncbi:MAG: hypothetical protein Q8L69_09250 [Gallionellaceae bacterium]|nr:hypothetical protein [Gallionellaceae bacterium]